MVPTVYRVMSTVTRVMSTVFVHMMPTVMQGIHAMGSSIALHLVADLSICSTVFLGDPFSLGVALFQHIAVSTAQMTFCAIWRIVTTIIAVTCGEKEGQSHEREK